MRKLLLLCVVFTGLSGAMNQAFSKPAKVDELANYDLRFYHPEKYGLRDLAVQARIP